MTEVAQTFDAFLEDFWQHNPTQNAAKDSLLESILNNENETDNLFGHLLEDPVGTTRLSDPVPSPLTSDGYLTDKPSPYSDSAGSESSSGISHPSGPSDDLFESLLNQPLLDASAHLQQHSYLSSLGEPTAREVLGETAALQFSQDGPAVGRDLDLLEMNAGMDQSSDSSSLPSPLPSCSARLKASSKCITEEERNLLESEGIYLPSDMPLTKSEEKHLRRIRRKINNRKSAQESRQRKKEYIDGLEERVERCTTTNRTLQKKVGDLEKQNKSLISELKRLQKVVMRYNPSALQAGTCVMVLFLSFSLFFIPKFLSQNEIGLEDTAMATGAIAMGVRSRSILETATDEFGNVLAEGRSSDSKTDMSHDDHVIHDIQKDKELHKLKNKFKEL